MIRSEALTTSISGEISAASTPVTSILGGQSINNNLTDIDEVREAAKSYFLGLVIFFTCIIKQQREVNILR